MSDHWLGLDIGGANIKHADLQGSRSNVEFALWKQPHQLAATLQQAIPDWPSHVQIAVTMTGELADCFETRQQGVSHICDAVVSASSARRILFYQISGNFVDTDLARENWRLTSASNWHAAARFVGLTVPNCIVIDIGSTTTDIIPVINGTPAAIGNSDLGRLKNSELIYTGVSRSPVCAVIQYVSVDGTTLPIAQEFFATMLDVYLILKKIPESSSSRHTADGRAADLQSAFNRLARAVCGDRLEIAKDTLISIADQAARRQSAMIQATIGKVAARLGSDIRYVVSGEGAWLAEQLLVGMHIDRNRIHGFAEITGTSLDETEGVPLNDVSTAYAIARLAALLDGGKPDPVGSPNSKR